MAIPTNTDMYTYLRASYLGGRVEVFDSGISITNVYHFDVPGLYAGMMQKDLPYGNPVYINSLPDTTTRELFIKELHGAKFFGFFKGTAVCPQDLNIPVLPIKLNEKLTFPTGTFTGT